MNVNNESNPFKMCLFESDGNILAGFTFYSELPL